MTSNDRNRHRQRWDEIHHKARHHVRVVVIEEDQPQLRVRAGEQYLAISYVYDPENVTALRRIPDGYDPDCNQYLSEVRWLRWATTDEAKSVNR